MDKVIQVKILGILGMIDDGETDWKVLAIDTNDDRAHTLNGILFIRLDNPTDIDDIESVFPGKIQEIVSFFRYYKTPAGKEPNDFAFNGEPKDQVIPTLQTHSQTFAMDIIHKTHNHWQSLMNTQSQTKYAKYHSIQP